MNYDSVEQKKDYLLSARNIAKRHYAVQTEYIQYCSRILSPKSIIYGEHISSGEKIDLSRNEVKKSDYQKKLLSLRSQYIKQFTEIQNAIYRTCQTDNERNFLKLMYLKNKNYNEISAVMGLCKRQLYNIHKSALSNFTPLVDGWETMDHF